MKTTDQIRSTVFLTDPQLAKERLDRVSPARLGSGSSGTVSRELF